MKNQQETENLGPPGQDWVGSLETISEIRGRSRERYSPTRKPYVFIEPTLIELIWTITPALILILIAFPSFKLLY